MITRMSILMILTKDMVMRLAMVISMAMIITMAMVISMVMSLSMDMTMSLLVTTLSTTIPMVLGMPITIRGLMPTLIITMA